MKRALDVSSAGALTSQPCATSPFTSAAIPFAPDGVTSSGTLDLFAQQLLQEQPSLDGLDSNLFASLDQPAFPLSPPDQDFLSGANIPFAQEADGVGGAAIPSIQAPALAFPPTPVPTSAQLANAQPSEQLHRSSGSGTTLVNIGQAGAALSDRQGSPHGAAASSGSIGGQSAGRHSPHEGHKASADAHTKLQMDKFKEKNRTAQKRYRERQKAKLQESEDKVAELSAQLEALKTEKDTLAQRNALLEKFLAMQQQQQSAGNASLIEGEGSAWWLDTHTRSLVERTLNLTGQLTFTVNEGSPMLLTREQVAHLPMEEFTNLWKAYINAYASCLVDANGDENSPAGQRLARLVFEAGQIKACIALTFPDRIHSFHLKHLQASDPAAKEETSWPQLLRTVALTEEQRRVLICLRRMYLTNLGVLVARRRQLSAALQASLPGSEQHVCIGTNYLESVATMDKLRETLRDEHSFLVQFMLTMWRRCLTPFQAANLHIQAYPRAPDLLQLINHVAAEAGEPSFAELLHSGSAASSSTALLPLDAVVGLLPASLADFGIKHVEFVDQGPAAEQLRLPPLQVAQ